MLIPFPGSAQSELFGFRAIARPGPRGRPAPPVCRACPPTAHLHVPKSSSPPKTIRTKIAKNANHALSFLNVKLYFGNGDKPVGDAKISGSRVSPVSYLCASDGLARRLTPEARGVRRSGWLSSKYGGFRRFDTDDEFPR
mgnify:CR=1 FL=1